MCVTWDFNLNAWTPQGCTTSVGKNGVVICSCNHLTNFAVLVVCCETITNSNAITIIYIMQDICLRQESCERSKVQPFLTTVSYVGIPISIVCLIMTIAVLTSFKWVSSELYYAWISLCWSSLDVCPTVMHVMMQETSSERHLKLSYPTIYCLALHVSSILTTGDIECRKSSYYLWRLFVCVCPCALLYLGSCDVDGSWGSPHVSEGCHCLCSHIKEVHYHCISRLLE